MNIQRAIEHINQQVFKTIYLKNIRIKDIEEIKNHYPYFTLVRYLLAYQKKEKFQNTTLEASLQQDPLWFGYVLENMNKKAQPTEITTTLMETNSNNTPVHTTHNENNIITISKEAENTQSNNSIQPLEQETFSNSTTQEICPIVPKLQVTKLSEQQNEIDKNTTEEIVTEKRISIKKEYQSTSPNDRTSPIVPLYVEDYFSAINRSLPESKQHEPKLITATASKPKSLEKQRPFLDWLDEFSVNYKKSNAIASSDKNDTPVASETMAEIWIAEKRYDKAILTYEKLSLLFPEKSIYFAQRISELKNRLNK